MFLVQDFYSSVDSIQWSSLARTSFKVQEKVQSLELTKMLMIVVEYSWNYLMLLIVLV